MGTEDGFGKRDFKRRVYLDAKNGVFRYKLSKDGEPMEGDFAQGMILGWEFRWKEANDNVEAHEEMLIYLEAKIDDKPCDAVIQTTFPTSFSISLGSRLVDLKRGDRIKVSIWPNENNSKISMCSARRVVTFGDNTDYPEIPIPEGLPRGSEEGELRAVQAALHDKKDLSDERRQKITKKAIADYRAEIQADKGDFLKKLLTAHPLFMPPKEKKRSEYRQPDEAVADLAIDPTVTGVHELEALKAYDIELVSKPPTEEQSKISLGSDGVIMPRLLEQFDALFGRFDKFAWPKIAGAIISEFGADTIHCQPHEMDGLKDLRVSEGLVLGKFLSKLAQMPDKEKGALVDRIAYEAELTPPDEGAVARETDEYDPFADEEGL